jgi:hypothetical protein
VSLTPDTDAPVEHRQTIATRAVCDDGLPGPGATIRYRRECSCKYRGTWLRNPEKVAPCPRAQEVR